VLEQVQRAFDAFGPQRLMWGTDHAMTQKICDFTLKQALGSVDTALKNASPEDRAWVKGGTAARIWKLG
jgi:predicted TIM-barrel fold metal-dependent hydrolase